MVRILSLLVILLCAGIVNAHGVTAGFFSLNRSIFVQRSVFAQPVFAQPVYATPVFAQPVYTQPVFSAPVFRQPVVRSERITVRIRRR